MQNLWNGARGVGGRWPWLLPALMVLAALLGGPMVAFAHGGGEPVLTREPLGDFLLYVWANPAAPQAGEPLHLTIGVTQLDAAGAEAPITDAAVVVEAIAADGTRTTVAAEPGAAAGGVYYEADLQLESGAWAIGVGVTPADGSRTDVIEFPLTVTADAGTTWWLVWLGSAAIVLGLVLYLVAVIRGRSKVAVAPQ